jgi:two-component system response regulator HydG
MNNESYYHVLMLERDSRQVREALAVLAQRNLRGTVATTARAARTFLEQYRWHLVFVGDDFPVESGGGTSDLLALLRTEHPEVPIVMICENQASKAAVAGLRGGCVDVLEKPLEAQAVQAVLDRWLPNHKAGSVATVLGDDGRVYPIVGRSEPLKRAVRMAETVAATSAPVLITGPSGTGKELLAGLIHNRSKRCDGPLVRVNCAALSESLLESELFGHEKGAFTGALMCHKGRLERAHGGTLFLDEITETPAPFQAKLLRALEQMRFERVGGSESIRVNVRVVSTTNQDIVNLVNKGQFRADLYYRLCGVHIAMPALAERKEDLPELIWWFVNEFAGEAGRAITAIDRRTLEIFNAYSWPGNVRQLRNVVRTAMILGKGPNLSITEMPWVLQELRSHLGTQRFEQQESLPLAGRPLEELERRAILETLRQEDGNRTRAARVLGISDRTLRQKVKKYNDALEPVGADVD